MKDNTINTVSSHKIDEKVFFPNFQKILIFENIYLEKSIVDKLTEESKLEQDEIINRLKQIYVQSSKNMENIVEQFTKNNYDVLKTLKSLYSSKIITSHKEQPSINQLRMQQIRNYMNEREKIKTTQQK